MNNLFDFITHVKGVEYLLALSAIGIFIIFWEMLKDKPFPFFKETAQDDFVYLKQIGISGLFKIISRLIVAPFIGLCYLLVLPFAFIYILMIAILSPVFVLIGRETAFGWKPMEAYLSGRNKKINKNKKNNK
jgi:hypothetical protein